MVCLCGRRFGKHTDGHKKDRASTKKGLLAVLSRGGACYLSNRPTLRSSGWGGDGGLLSREVVVVVRVSLGPQLVTLPIKAVSLYHGIYGHVIAPSVL